MLVAESSDEGEGEDSTTAGVEVAEASSGVEAIARRGRAYEQEGAVDRDRKDLVREERDRDMMGERRSS